MRSRASGSLIHDDSCVACVRACAPRTLLRQTRFAGCRLFDGVGNPPEASPPPVSHKYTTLVDGYLGMNNDEERSEMRYVVRIAEFSESSKL